MPGSTIVLNTDAHGVDTLDNMHYAVATARRAWLTADRRRQHPRLARVQAILELGPSRRSLRSPGVRTSSIGRRAELGTT